jgi:hypothetical protein
MSARYLVGGGQALRHHGSDRPVSDIDLYVDVEGNNPSLVFAAVINILGEEPLPGVTIEALGQPRKRFPICKEGLALDIFTTLPGLVFGEALFRCDFLIQDGLRVPVLSHSDLLRHLRAVQEDPKRQAKADADLARLEALSNNPLQPPGDSD